MAPQHLTANGTLIEPDHAGVTTGLGGRKFVQDFLPFLTSLSLHAGVIVLGVLTYKAIQVVRSPAVQQQTVVAATDYNTTASDFKLRGDEKSLFRRTLQDQSPIDTDPASVNFTKGIRTNLLSPGGGSGSEKRDSVIGVGIGGFGAGNGLGSGKGSGTGSGTGDGGPLALFGTPTSGASGKDLFPLPAARRIAYVCDASGSMVNKFASLRYELNKAVAGLKVSQSFDVIFFQETRFTTLDAELLRATPQNKRKAGTFLENATASGTTNPIPGMEAAFRQQPELIFLLTDGDFPDNGAVLKKIRTLNPDHKVKINTIAFVGTGDSDTAFIDLLKTIARENGGTFKHVSEATLDQ